VNPFGGARPVAVKEVEGKEVEGKEGAKGEAKEERKEREAAPPQGPRASDGDKWAKKEVSFGWGR
jgi:hypothetical protein